MITDIKGETNAVLFNTVIKMKKNKEAETALQKINLEVYLITTIIRRKTTL